MAQDEVLREIRRNGSMTVEELSEELGINPNTVRTNLNGLYEWGFVDYEYGADNITRIYSLTDEGRRRVG